MTIQLSTGARNTSLSNGLQTAWNGGFMDLYTGAQPANADSAVTGTLLATVTLPATAFNAAASGSITLQGTWQCASAAATGTAGYFRMRLSGDAGGASATLVRMQGSVGTVGTDLILNNASISVGQQVTITAATITQPAQ